MWRSAIMQEAARDPVLLESQAVLVPVANDGVVCRLDVEFGVDAAVDDKPVERHVCVALAKCGEGSLNPSQLGAGLSTGGVEFAVHRWTVFQERGEATAGRYGAVLGGITGQDELGPGVGCERDEAGEIEGSDRAGFINDQDAAGIDDRFIGCGAVGSGEHCGDGLAGDAGGALEVLGCRSLYGGTEDAVAGGLPCSGGDSECEGLAGTGGANQALELVAVAAEFLYCLSLVGAERGFRIDRVADGLGRYDADLGVDAVAEALQDVGLGPQHRLRGVPRTGGGVVRRRDGPEAWSFGSGLTTLGVELDDAGSGEE